MPVKQTPKYYFTIKGEPASSPFTFISGNEVLVQHQSQSSN